MSSPQSGRSPQERYLARFRQVCEHIEGHLQDPLRVEALAAQAHFSACHFHRQFAALLGLNVGRYIQLCRLKRASYQLAFRDRQAVIEIALANGYEGPEAFARAFRKAVGQSPSEFRHEPQWHAWQAPYESLGILRKTHMKRDYQLGDVRILTVPDVRVAVLEHRGDPDRMADSIRRFIAWRREHALPPRASATYNILYDNPDEVEPAAFRLDLCAALAGPLPGDDPAIVEKLIPGGRCAVLRQVGPDDALGETLQFLYGQWLPQSGEEPRDFPPYVQRLRFFPDVPEHEAELDACLPLK